MSVTREGEGMIKVAICDDEAAICTQIERIVEKFSRQEAVAMDVELFLTGKELCRFIESEHSFDIIFLDIELNDINGVEVGKFIREKQNDQVVQIVYISAQTKYCMELFDIRPMNFLEKPIDEVKINKLLKLLLELYPGAGQIFLYRIGHADYKELIKNILYFESGNRTVRMVTQSGDAIFYSTLAKVQTQLAKSDFIQIHKSYLVNYLHVIEVGTKEVKMSNQQILPISQSQRKVVRARQLQYTKEICDI